ncbi:MAG: DUF4230 domain-containing protein [Erysipelotrichaceae bacterium]
MKIIKSIVLTIIIIIAVFLLLNFSNILNFNEDKTSRATLVAEKLVELSEWTTLRYEYSNVIVSRLEQSVNVFGITDFNYAETIKLIEYTGYIKAGTDMSKVEITIEEESNKIIVKVPKSQIIDNVVETENTRVEDLVGNIFSNYPTQIVFDEINKNKILLEEKKINDGFLEDADKRIEELLTSFLLSSGFEEIEIEFY